MSEPRIIWQSVDFEPFPRRWVEAIEYDKLCTENQLLKEKAKGLVETLKGCKAAMSYAYEDRADQYYMNVSATIDEALKAFSNEKGEE